MKVFPALLLFVMSLTHCLAQFDKLLAEQFKPDGPGCTALVARTGHLPPLPFCN